MNKLIVTVAALLTSSFVNASVVTVQKDVLGWQLYNGTTPYVVRGISYSADTVGQNPNIGNYQDWMVQDLNANGKPDGPYDSWVDKNNNNTQDGNEPTVGDFQLMKEMGVNTIRVYHHPSDDPELTVCYSSANVGGQLIWNHPTNKTLLRDLYNTYGIMTAMGDEVGAYTTSSCASWAAGTDYTDPVQKYNMRASVRRMVLDFKDEPWLLMYVLGNENNYDFTHTNANTHLVEYYAFINELAKMIHELDPNHPVALANGEVATVPYIRDHAPNIDIFGANVYRNPGQFYGFGTFFTDVAQWIDKPVLLTEYGLAYPRYTSGQFDEAYQAAILENYWCDIRAHGTGRKIPQNAIGGFVYGWLDSWWQNGSESSLYVGIPNSETTGLVGQGNGTNSPYQRNPKKSYAMYKNLWTTANDCK